MPCSLHENVNDPFPPPPPMLPIHSNQPTSRIICSPILLQQPSRFINHIQNASPSYKADEFIHLPTKLSQQCCIFSCSLDINLKVQLELKNLTEKITTFDLPIQSKLSKETWVDRLLAATSEAAARP